MKTDLQHLDTEINAHPAANAIRRVPRIQRPRRMIATVLLRCEKCFPQGAIDISALLHDSFCFDACEVGVLNHLCVTSGPSRACCMQNCFREFAHIRRQWSG